MTHLGRDVAVQPLGEAGQVPIDVPAEKEPVQQRSHTLRSADPRQALGTIGDVEGGGEFLRAMQGFLGKYGMCCGSKGSGLSAYLFTGFAPRQFLRLDPR